MLSSLRLIGIIVIVALLAVSMPVTATKGYVIQINIAARRLDLLSNGRIVKEYPVAVGKLSTPSIEGNFQIVNKVIDPVWYPEGRIPVEPGPNNPVGTRWLGLNLPGYGIHGTNDPTSIGQAVSNGCFRMHNHDIEELFSLVTIGTPVQLFYEPLEVTKAPGELGPVMVRVHRDIYHRSGATLERLQEILGWVGVTGLPTETLVEMLALRNGQPQTIPRKYTAELNGITFDFHLRVDKGRLQVDAYPLVRLLGFQRVGLEALLWIMDRGWRLEPEEAATILRLAVSLDQEQGRLKFTAPYILADDGEVKLAQVDADSRIIPEGEAGYTVVFPGGELPFSRVAVEAGNQSIPTAGYRIGDLTWVDLQPLVEACPDLSVQWQPAEQRLLLDDQVIPGFLAYQDRLLVPLVMVQEIIGPEQGRCSGRSGED